MIFSSSFNGLPVKTGDIICTSNGRPDNLLGAVWRLIGRLVPGEVDHVAIYLGPQGRCVEAGNLGVIMYEMPEGCWQSESLMASRGLYLDEFFGVAYPLKRMGLKRKEEDRIRKNLAAYCLANLGKPYNLNFLDIEREDAFYCSQLVYKALQTVGIEIKSEPVTEPATGASRIIFPQEIWDAFSHRRADYTEDTFSRI